MFTEFLDYVWFIFELQKSKKNAWHVKRALGIPTKWFMNSWISKQNTQPSQVAWTFGFLILLASSLVLSFSFSVPAGYWTKDHTRQLQLGSIPIPGFRRQVPLYPRLASKWKSDFPHLCWNQPYLRHLHVSSIYPWPANQSHLMTAFCPFWNRKLPISHKAPVVCYLSPSAIDKMRGRHTALTVWSMALQELYTYQWTIFHSRPVMLCILI